MVNIGMHKVRCRNTIYSITRLSKQTDGVQNLITDFRIAAEKNNTERYFTQVGTRSNEI